MTRITQHNLLPVYTHNSNIPINCVLLALYTLYTGPPYVDFTSVPMDMHGPNNYPNCTANFSCVQIKCSVPNPREHASLLASVVDCVWDFVQNTKDSNATEIRCTKFTGKCGHSFITFVRWSAAGFKDRAL